MRLIQKELRPVHLFKQEELDSGYVGTEVVPVYIKTVMCNVQPAGNQITVEAYGEKALNMLSILCGGKPEGVTDVSLTGQNTPSHKIVSITVYTTHTKLLAEEIL